MVLGVVAILTFLLADFTFETKLNKIKIYNQQDKIQARLNAESGLNFALGKLRLYQEGRNKIEKNEGIKSSFPTSDLESIIIEPFVFPPPINTKANIIQKTALDELFKKTIFNGEVSVTFNKISGFLNPNGLRFPDKPSASKEPPPEDQRQDQDSNPNEKVIEPGHIVIEKKMTETLQNLLKEKNDTDEEFHLSYANVNAELLIKELKYYVNNKGVYQDSMIPEIEANFSQKNISPKFAPMTSIDELYLLPSWDDAIVNLIKDRMSVHEVSVIAINELTVADLKILFPSINNIQIEEFFKYRDGDTDKKIVGKKFKNADDFKRIVVSELNILNETDYQERIDSLKTAGLVIDTAGKLYKVTSRGSMNNAVYNLIAYIDLPIKPRQKKSPVKRKGAPEDGIPPNESLDPNEKSPPPGTPEKKEKEEQIELLVPRVVEIRLE